MSSLLKLHGMYNDPQLQQDDDDINYNATLWWSSLNVNQSSNWTTNATNCWQDNQINFYVKVLFIAVYSIIGLLSFVGNCFIVVVVVLRREIRTSPTNIFVANLAVSDLIIACSTLWMSPTLALHPAKQWLNRGLCYTYFAVSSTSILISTFTLTAIALERYVMIIYPFNNFPFSAFGTNLAVAILWCLAVFVASPMIIHVNYVEFERCDQIHRFCSEHLWDPTIARVFYGGVILVIKTLLPSFIIAFCYIRISQRLNEIERRLKGRKSSLRDLADIQKKQNLHRVLVSMVLIFVCCSMPLDLLNLFNDIDWYMKLGYQSTHNIPEFHLAAHFIEMTATLWNPLLYAWWNENFRKEFHSAVRCRSNDGGGVVDEFLLEERRSHNPISRLLSSRMSVNNHHPPPSNSHHRSVSKLSSNNHHPSIAAKRSVETQLLLPNCGSDSKLQHHIHNCSEISSIINNDEKAIL